MTYRSQRCILNKQLNSKLKKSHGRKNIDRKTTRQNGGNPKKKEDKINRR